MSTTPRLEARNVSKTFGSTKVLHDATLVVQPGEIHSLVGQNGCGKSTLVKVLTGYHAPDAGASLALDGQRLALPVQWRAANSAGMSVVHQDLGLVDHLTVAENIVVGGYQTSGPVRHIDWKRQHQYAAATLERLEIPVSTKALVGELSASRRAAVGLARALRDQAPGGGVMILDEATRSLPKDELERFHELVRRIAASGTSIIMISHSLDEVLSLSHKVTVLRDGHVVGEGLDATGLTEADLAKHMLGKTVERLGTRAGTPQTGTVAARITGLTVPGVGAPIDLEIARGEVLGITGLPGTGFEEIPYLVSGARPSGTGSVTTEAGTVELAKGSVAKLMKAGVAMVPERRIRDGVAVELSVRDNVALPNFRRLGKAWYVARNWQERMSREAIGRLGIKTGSSMSLLKELSGGNQQKVLFAKWLSVEPHLLVLHEPTQAVDVGARADLLRVVAEAADAGMAVLLVSTEPSDLVEASDRILVLNPGLPPRELRTDSEDELLDAIYAVPMDVV